jgi:hypothetical protein
MHYAVAADWWSGGTMLYCCCFSQGGWNPVTFAVQVLLEASMNMGGHCGYLLPHWLQFLVTLGIGNTPWSGEYV